jgi:hypothetical protein
MEVAIATRRGATGASASPRAISSIRAAMLMLSNSRAPRARRARDDDAHTAGHPAAGRPSASAR